MNDSSAMIAFYKQCFFKLCPGNTNDFVKVTGIEFKNVALYYNTMPCRFGLMASMQNIKNNNLKHELWKQAVQFQNLALLPTTVWSGVSLLTTLSHSFFI